MKELSVLQLDTSFPRLPGDVACRETFNKPINLVKVHKASVSQIVTETPSKRSLVNFQDQVRKNKERIIATSCGFTFLWQKELQNLTNAKFISSSLCALDYLQKYRLENNTLLLTFNAKILNSMLNKYLGRFFLGTIVDLGAQSHFAQVIIKDKPRIDRVVVENELAQLLKPIVSSLNIKTLIIECTNLVPFKPKIRQIVNCNIIDILTLIELESPGLVKSEHL